MTRLERIIEADALMARFRIDRHIYGGYGLSDVGYERATDALAIAHGLALEDARQEHENPGLRRRVPFLDKG